MAMRGMIRALGLAAGWAMQASAALACSFHLYLPERTVVDRLMETENVVLARPDPEDPFRFRAVEALEGTLEQADLPTLVDSTTRRRLAANPEATVLFARDGGAYGPFERLALIEGEYRAVLDHVMARKEDWIMGDDLERFGYFAGLLNSDTPEVRALALRELDRAPYDLLKQLDLQIDTAPILRDLWDITDIPLAPIRVLLLGFAEDETARAEIADGLARAAEYGNLRLLGPLAVATIEIDGAAGVDTLARLFLADPGQPRDALELVVEAMAIQAGASAPALRAEILATLAVAADSHPETAGAIARQFSSRYDFGMAEALEALYTEGRFSSANVLLPVAAYVAIARQDDTMLPTSP